MDITKNPKPEYCRYCQFEFETLAQCIGEIKCSIVGGGLWNQYEECNGAYLFTILKKIYDKEVGESLEITPDVQLIIDTFIDQLPVSWEEKIPEFLSERPFIFSRVKKRLKQILAESESEKKRYNIP